MICRKCGKPLSNEGAICTFCGVMMQQDQLKEQKKMQDPNQGFKANLLSDKYGVNKDIIYEKDKPPKENKILGAAIILIIVLFLIVLAILLNAGR